MLLLNPFYTRQTINALSKNKSLVSLSGKLSLHDPYEYLFKSSLEDIENKVEDTSKIKSFTRVTNSDKKSIFQSRLRLYTLLLPMDRKKAKEDFIEFSYNSSSEVRKEMDNE